VASTPGRIRPWRHLAAFAGIVVVLYALVFFTGDKATPKLGIDLQGGTRVTLTARTESGGEPPREQLLQAQSIIEQRVNGLGVSGAEVVLDGTNITITVPGEEGDQARSLGQTAQLRFREVVGGPVAAMPAAAPTQPATDAPNTDAPNTDAPNTDAPATDTPTGTTLPPQGASGDAPVTRDVAPVALAQPLPATPPSTSPNPSSKPSSRPSRPSPPPSSTPSSRPSTPFPRPSTPSLLPSRQAGRARTRTCSCHRCGTAPSCC